MFSLDGSLKESVFITVRNEIEVRYGLTGANVSSDRKAVTGSDYKFTLTPQPGYGLQPTVKFSFLSGEYIPGKEDIGSLSISYADKEYSIVYTFDSPTGAYAFTLPGDLMGVLSNDITITASFPKVYTLAFSTEGGDSNEGTDGYYTLTVEAGSYIKDLDGTPEFSALQSWIEALSRDGFDLRGFYLTNNANSLQGYGKSFADMLTETDTTVVNGAMMFYARWTYNVVVETPGRGKWNRGSILRLCRKGSFRSTIKTALLLSFLFPKVGAGIRISMSLSVRTEISSRSRNTVFPAIRKICGFSRQRA